MGRIKLSDRKKILFLGYFLLSSLWLSGQSRYVAFTIDDLPASSYHSTEYAHINVQMLKTLKRYLIQAVGFVNEEKLYTDNKPDSLKIAFLKTWIISGMELGNHTYSHININNATPEEYKKDVLMGELITRPLLKKYSKELKYFRHTQLRTGPTDTYRRDLNNFLEERKYTVAPVTLDNDEYIYAYCYDEAKRRKDDEKMKVIGADYLNYMVNIFEHYENLSLTFLGYEIKQILLLHANNLNADYLDELIELLILRNYTFITLDEALKDKAYTLPEGTHSRGLSWLNRWQLAAGLPATSQPEVSIFITNLFNAYR